MWKTKVNDQVSLKVIFAIIKVLFYFSLLHRALCTLRWQSKHRKTFAPGQSLSLFAFLFNQFTIHHSSPFSHWSHFNCASFTFHSSSSSDHQGEVETICGTCTFQWTGRLVTLQWAEWIPYFQASKLLILLLLLPLLLLFKRKLNQLKMFSSNRRASVAVVSGVSLLSILLKVEVIMPGLLHSPKFNGEKKRKREQEDQCNTTILIRVKLTSTEHPTILSFSLPHTVWSFASIQQQPVQLSSESDNAIASINL